MGLPFHPNSRPRPWRGGSATIGTREALGATYSRERKPSMRGVAFTALSCPFWRRPPPFWNLLVFLGSGSAPGFAEGGGLGA